MVLETIVGTGTAIGASLASLTMLDRDSKTVRNYRSGTCRLIDVVSFSQLAGRVRIASPNMHDPTNGIRLQHTAADPTSLVPKGRFFQTFNPQEVLTFEATGSVTAGDIESHAITLQYDDVPGLTGRFIDEATLGAAVEELLAVEVAYTAATTAVYGTAVAINATVDNFIANRVYAVLGAESTLSQGIVTIQGAETGNLRIGIPLHKDKKEQGKDYFVQSSRESGLPMIPIFNSANKANFLVQTVNNENAASPVISFTLALLRKDMFPE